MVLDFSTDILLPAKLCSSYSATVSDLPFLEVDCCSESNKMLYERFNHAQTCFALENYTQLHMVTS